MNPIFMQAIMGIFTEVLEKKPLNPMAAVKTAITKNPVITNETNSEHPVQSRVVVGASMGVISALGIIFTQVGGHPFPEYDWSVMVPAVVAVGGGAFALFGRLKSGLKPFTWFGFFKHD